MWEVFLKSQASEKWLEEYSKVPGKLLCTFNMLIEENLESEGKGKKQPTILI